MSTALKRVRMTAMRAFLDDYAPGRAEGRYLDAGLPSLPFADGAFDLALCSHFLFLYSQQFDAAFHVQSIRELCRVAREVRVFPLLALGAQPSPHLGAARDALTRPGLRRRRLSGCRMSSSAAATRCCGCTHAGRCAARDRLSPIGHQERVGVARPARIGPLRREAIERSRRRRNATAAAPATSSRLRRGFGRRPHAHIDNHLVVVIVPGGAVIGMSSGVTVRRVEPFDPGRLTRS